MSSAPLDCRRLAATDIALMRDVLAMFAGAFEDDGRYASVLPRDAYLGDLLARDTFIAVVALRSGRVIGGLTAYVLVKFEQERSEIYIYDLAVAQPFRRQGVATALISKLRLIARSIGAYGIFVAADLEDAPAVALYRSLGREQTVHHFEIEP